MIIGLIEYSTISNIALEHQNKIVEVLRQNYFMRFLRDVYFCLIHQRTKFDPKSRLNP